MNEEIRYEFYELIDALENRVSVRLLSVEERRNLIQKLNEVSEFVQNEFA
nr:MAG TPA: hypothetical protein [Caudoviricetes sp.]DAX79918.1 MAG TPA: hypothetical protein [Caudoviricetes sp.]